MCPVEAKNICTLTTFYYSLKLGLQTKINDITFLCQSFGPISQISISSPLTWLLPSHGLEQGVKKHNMVTTLK
jgi:hypothetical protein